MVGARVRALPQAGPQPTIITQGEGGYCTGHIPGDPGKLGPSIKDIKHRQGYKPISVRGKGASPPLGEPGRQ